MAKYDVAGHIFSLSADMNRNETFIALQRAETILQAIADESVESAVAIEKAIDAIWYHC